MNEPGEQMSSDDHVSSRTSFADLLESQEGADPTESSGIEDVKYPGKGFRLGKYTITGLLGHGAMASVFLADDGSGNDVAVKMFHENAGVSKTMLERFKREAEASKKLRRHPNIITIYETGKEGPYHYIVMEPISNSLTLEMALEQKPMSMKAVVEIIVKIARALQYAHSRNIIHRDVKPTNIMIDEFNEPLLSDFGVAALIDWPSCTVTGALTGTPLYMSPEQANAEAVGPASDIYSLGVVLFEAVTGVLPYSTQHAAPIKDVLAAVREELPKRPRMYRKEVTAELEAVIFKALEKNPKDRYIDAEAFAVDLERALAGKAVSAHHFTVLDRVRHLARLHERLLSTVFLLVFVGSGVGFYFRARLIEARYDNLLSLAWRENARYILAGERDTTEPEETKPRAWQEIRVARRSMSTGNWQAALTGLRSAANLSTAIGDNRTRAIAQLDLARCETLLGNHQQAMATYSTILDNPDAPPALSSLAQFEFISLAFLFGQADDPLKILMSKGPPSEGPIRDAISCLAGDLPIDDIVNRVESMPLRFRNDVYLSIALRYHLDGDSRKLATYLKKAATSSTPSSEWPGPYARQLRTKLL